MLRVDAVSLNGLGQSKLFTADTTSSNIAAFSRTMIFFARILDYSEALLNRLYRPTFITLLLPTAKSTSSRRFCYDIRLTLTAMATQNIDLEHKTNL